LNDENAHCLFLVRGGGAAIGEAASATVQASENRCRGYVNGKGWSCRQPQQSVLPVRAASARGQPPGGRPRTRQIARSAVATRYGSSYALRSIHARSRDT